MGISAAGIAAALVTTSLASSSSAATRTASPAIPAVAAQRLGTMMETVAKMSGDARPAWMAAVMTTRDKALQIATPGDRIPDSADRTVYLVIMKGNFTLDDASVPPKAHAPTGHYLAITFDPATFQVMDLGLRNHAPPASFRTLGPVTMLAQK